MKWICFILVAVVTSRDMYSYLHVNKRLFLVYNGYINIQIHYITCKHVKYTQ